MCQTAHRNAGLKQVELGDGRRKKGQGKRNRMDEVVVLCGGGGGDDERWRSPHVSVQVNATKLT